MPVPGPEDELLFRGPAWVGGSFREVDCRAGPRRYLLSIPGAGRFAIARDGDRLAAAADPTASAALFEEALVGPALILALALGGTVCLHASAVATPRGAVLLAGESGAGKSTLARHLAETAGLGGLVADDIVPVRQDEGEVVALPAFPQLKLAADRQPGARHPRLPLLRLYLLAAGEGPPLACRLAPREAVLALVRQTVAAKLFAPDLLAWHLDAAASMATRGLVHRLGFRRRLEELPAIAREIARDLALGGEL